MSANAPAQGVSAKTHRASPLYAFVKDHLVVSNNVILASATLVGALDFLAPKLWIAPAIIYGATAGLLLLMVAAAAAPAKVARLISALGFEPKAGEPALWRKPAWQFSVAILLGVSVGGFASVAKAGQGGLIASHFPAARSLQESMLGLRLDVADIRARVDSANGKLDALASRSADPQRDLASLGYPYDDHGLTKAIKQADARALGLFVQAGYKAEDRVPMLNLLNGGQPWSPEIARMLPKTMFESEASCDEAGLLNGQIKEPATERIAAFKRLCPAGKAIDSLRARIRLDGTTPAMSDGAAKDYAARRRNLAELFS